MIASDENGQQHTGEEAGQQAGDLAVFSDLDRQMTELRAFDASRVFNYRDPADNKAARSHVYQLRRTKTAIDQQRKSATKPLRERIDAINAEGKRLIGEVDGLIETHARELERVEDEERGRQERLQSAVDRLRDLPNTELEADAERLYVMAAEAEALVIDEAAWGDYAVPAQHARDKAVQLLRMRADKAAAVEEAEAVRERERAERERERAELEALRREKAEREGREKAEREAREAREAREGREKGEHEAREAREAREGREKAEHEAREAREAEAEAESGDAGDAGDAGGAGDAGDARDAVAATAAIDALVADGIEHFAAVRVVESIRGGRVPYVTFAVEG